MNWDWDDYDLVGGLEHFFSIIYGIILPIDSYFSRWLLHHQPVMIKISGEVNMFLKKMSLYSGWRPGSAPPIIHSELDGAWTQWGRGHGHKKWGVFPSKKTVQIESLWLAEWHLAHLDAFGPLWILMEYCCIAAWLIKKDGLTDPLRLGQMMNGIQDRPPLLTKKETVHFASKKSSLHCAHCDWQHLKVCGSWKRIHGLRHCDLADENDNMTWYTRTWDDLVLENDLAKNCRKWKLWTKRWAASWGWLRESHVDILTCRILIHFGHRIWLRLRMSRDVPGLTAAHHILQLVVYDSEQTKMSPITENYNAIQHNSKMSLFVWCMMMYIQVTYGYGSIPIHTIFRGMNIHLPAILMFTRGIGFWPIPIWSIWIYDGHLTSLAVRKP